MSRITIIKLIALTAVVLVTLIWALQRHTFAAGVLVGLLPAIVTAILLGGVILESFRGGKNPFL